MPRLTVLKEPLHRLISEGLEDMAVEHWHEVEADRDGAPYWLDLRSGYAMEAAGGLQLYAFRIDGALVGYASIILGGLHGKGQAFLDSVFVAPDRRGYGAVFWRKMEGLLRAQGVQRFIAEVRDDVALSPSSGHGTVGDLLRALGYSYFATVYIKRL